MTNLFFPNSEKIFGVVSIKAMNNKNTFVGVSILSPLNGLLFINLFPVTTLLISIFQGNPVTSFDLLGTGFIIVSLVSNNMFVRMQQKKEANQPVQTYLHERVS